MKTVLKYIFIAWLCFCGRAFSHDVPVHEAITVNAAKSAYINSPGYHSFADVIASDFSYFGPKGATNSMRIGSASEDDPRGQFPTDVGGYRSLNHFYDPIYSTYGRGLSDSIIFAGPGPIGDERALLGTNSFAWASISNCTGIGSSHYPNFSSDSHPTNTWSWQNARYFEWLGLTATNQNILET